MTETAPEETPAADPAPVLPTDSLGRPVLPPAQAYQDALDQGYYGNDGLDTGALVHPEDVHSFTEAAARIDQPAHSEPMVYETTPPAGYSALGLDGGRAPVQGNATEADNPSSFTVSAPVEAISAADAGITPPAEENV